MVSLAHLAVMAQNVRKKRIFLANFRLRMALEFYEGGVCSENPPYSQGKLSEAILKLFGSSIHSSLFQNNGKSGCRTPQNDSS